MNAIEFLTHEHDKVRKVLAEIDQGSHKDETKRKMFDGLCQDLIRHETMEHKIWYPHFKNHDKLEDTVKHLLTEEKGAEKAIQAFDNVHSQEEWEKKFAKFKKDVEHHAEEEEKKLFPNVKKILDEATLEKIGKEMHAFKQQYQA
jgi:hemerythrin superfamily protein